MTELNDSETMLLKEVRKDLLKVVKSELENESYNNENYDPEIVNNAIDAYDVLKQSEIEAQKAYNESPEGKAEATNLALKGVVGKLFDAGLKQEEKNNDLTGLTSKDPNIDLDKYLDGLFK